jgi:hypothetical protein
MCVEPLYGSAPLTKEDHRRRLNCLPGAIIEPLTGPAPLMDAVRRRTEMPPTGREYREYIPVNRKRKEVEPLSEMFKEEPKNSHWKEILVAATIGAGAIMILTSLFVGR